MSLSHFGIVSPDLADTGPLQVHNVPAGDRPLQRVVSYCMTVLGIPLPHFLHEPRRYVSAFATASRVKFMLLHEVKNDDGIKNFFTELYELYIKAL